MYIFYNKSAPKHPWQNESSQRSEERLEKEGIFLPWHYNDSFGDDFKVLALTAGGFGAVFFVKSTRFGERIYAAKTLQRFLQKDYLELPTYKQERIAKDFLEEALPWLEMGQHPNIVSVHLLENVVHHTTKRNVPFVFSEFVERGDLRLLVIEKGSLSLEETFSVGLQICEGLLHAYKHGISAHKDLKPENIMVYKFGIYKVTDFSAGVLGSPGYMAPEQLVGVKVDHRADQFAIGLIMHDVFKGGDTQNEQINRAEYIRSHPERFTNDGIQEVVSDNLPASLRGIITRCFQLGIENRFDDVSELKNEMLNAYKGEFKKEYRFPEVEIDDSPVWWFNRGLAFCNIGHYNSGEMPLREALRRIKAIPGTEIDQAKCLINIGIVYKSTDRFHEAQENYKDALRILKTVPGTEIDQADCLMNLGTVHRNICRLHESEENYIDSLRAFKAVPRTEIKQANCLANMGNVYVMTGSFHEAEENYLDALRAFKAVPGTEIKQADCLMSLGNSYGITGRFYEAEANYIDALRVFKGIPGTEIDQAVCFMNLGNIYGSTGRLHEAEENYIDALRAFKAVPRTEIKQANCLMNLGVVYRRTGGFNEAEANFKDALMMFRAIPGTEIDQAGCLMNLGNAIQNNDRLNEAEENYKEALMMYKAILGTEIDQGRCLMNLGSVYRNTYRFNEAETNFKKALREFKDIPIEQARCFMNLGILYISIHGFTKAQRALKDALEICMRYPIGTEQIKNACLQILSQIP
ncbi:MAG: serine/threonine-protein kinase [Candidatus Methanoperedens sp.]|nr:serine/threonine-protein kinase [Candidatus Methanoperedens sp.]